MVVYYVSFCAIAALALYLWKRSQQKQDNSGLPLSQDEFTRKCLEKLRLELPQYNFMQESEDSIASTHDGQGYKTFTGNLYRQYLQNPAAKDSLIAQIAIMPHLTKIQYNSKPETKNILPIVRNVSQTAHLMKALSEAVEGQNLAVGRYNSDLNILYVLDAEAQFRYLSMEELPNLGLDIDTVYEVSLANLRRKRKEVSISLLKEGLYSVKCDNVYESSMILLDDFWTKENFPLEKNLIITISNRNCVLVSSSDHLDLLQPMMKLAIELYKTEAYPVSPLLYQQKAGKFERVETVSVTA
ncbi:DUF1444 family protein [Chitinophaga sp. Cy-1792]|uniref:DUF1444 family protein n=1 Tax=Chitinophaga sp. Cy-1792 TaxID=2608339 RepID=UPI0014210372|nr:DUF1444 family protein [Chitinophaga sp. Cy-1792]